MAYRSGAPCSVERENINNNNASFSTVANKDAPGMWREYSQIQGMPARTSHTPDTTAYASPPIEDSWQVRLSGSGSPANTAGSQRGGQVT